jgi:thioredoxin-related protein
MSDKFKKVETAAHVALIVLAVLLSAALYKRFFSARTHDRLNRSQVKAGTHLSSLGVEWAESRRTILLALSTSCHYCTDSAPFYRQLAQECADREDLKLVAAFPQPTSDARRYLSGIGVVVDDVIHVSPDDLGISGTPTLILVDGNGTAQRVWKGKLPSDKEFEVLNEVRREIAAPLSQ